MKDFRITPSVLKTETKAKTENSKIKTIAYTYISLINP